MELLIQTRVMGVVMADRIRASASGKTSVGVLGSSPTAMIPVRGMPITVPISFSLPSLVRLGFLSGARNPWRVTEVLSLVVPLQK